MTDPRPLVVFLRGCNVGGSRTFRPTRLAAQLKRYDVVNIGAAGTFVVRKPIGQTKLRAELRRRLPFEADIMICEGRRIVDIASADLFAGERVRPDVVRFVSVFAKRPLLAPAVPLKLPEDGKWVVNVLGIEDRFLFGMYRRQMKTISYLGALDRLFGERATTRNWNTIAAIARVLHGGR